MTPGIKHFKYHIKKSNTEIVLKNNVSINFIPEIKQWLNTRKFMCAYIKFNMCAWVYIHIERHTWIDYIQNHSLSLLK